ncbi:MAG: hypothetical protein ACRDTI_15850 [Mycobacterium sp.]
MNSDPMPDAEARHRAPRHGIWKRLWFRNTVASLVACGAYAASIYLDVLRAPLYADYFEARFPSHSIARGHIESINGQDWSLTDVRELSQVPLARKLLPKDTAMMVARIERYGTPSPTEPCQAFLVDGDRRWRAESSFSDYWVKPPDDGTTQVCYKPGPLQFSFLVPVNVKPRWIEILNADGSLKARLEL